MVNHGYLCLTIVIHLKTKKYHNSTQNCPFSMIFGPKVTEISLRFFSRRQLFKIPLYLMSFFYIKFWYKKKKTSFSKVKIRTSLGVPTASRPTRGGDHMVPYDTICYHMVPYGFPSCPFFQKNQFSSFQFLHYSIFPFPKIFSVFLLFFQFFPVFFQDARK